MYNSVKKNVLTSDFVIGPVISLDITCLCSQCTIHIHTAATLVQRVVCYIMLVAVLINGIAVICADIFSIFW